MTLREKLSQAKWLPGSLPYLLEASWSTEKNIKDELTRVLRQIEDIPDDGSCGSLLPKEKQFLEQFKNEV